MESGDRKVWENNLRRVRVTAPAQNP